MADVPSSVADHNLVGSLQTPGGYTHRHRHYCGGVFKGQGQLRRRNRAKRDGTSFACSQCHRVFLKKGTLTEHVRHIHDKQSRYQCDICGKGFCILSHYLDHTATHTGIKRNVCLVCQKHFAYKSSLKVHVLRFHPEQAAQILDELSISVQK